MEFPKPLKLEFVAMLDRLKAMPGGDVVEGLADVLATTEPAVAVRVNPRKNAMPSGMRKVPWADRGFYVDGERPRFTMDPALHQGRYYVQDPSSMALSAIVGQLAKESGHKPLLYIDACAAPGGKTTAAIDALPPGSLVVANEFDRRRADALTENVIKWGYPDCVVSQGDTARFCRLPEIADIIAVDAPCSGEGMMRKEDAAVEQWSDGLVERCAGLQRDILGNMWAALRPGGYLIYSTCTFNRHEDEENLEYIVNELGGEPVDLDLPLGSGIAGAIASPYPAYRFLPGKVEGEGLFSAVVRK
ncbi:MAG: RsmB/NOP family class I SAM-dependent RNA methyltransferase, partial [Muribaculaceae bacterium]|nr:RsmB/NOP family class I SAM-dependent RNA methyltransferase [Muribaculaceae bacterium]